EEMVTFLKRDYIIRNPVMALDLLQKHESIIRTSIRTQGLEWFQRELSKILNAQMEKFRVYSLSKRFDNLSLGLNMRLIIVVTAWSSRTKALFSASTLWKWSTANMRRSVSTTRKAEVRRSWYLSGRNGATRKKYG